jgi:hypothetical protein
MTIEFCARCHQPVPEEEVVDLGGVRVHRKKPWHLFEKDALIEMDGDRPILHPDGSPIVIYDPPEAMPDVEP